MVQVAYWPVVMSYALVRHLSCFSPAVLTGCSACRLFVRYQQCLYHARWRIVSKAADVWPFSYQSVFLAVSVLRRRTFAQRKNLKLLLQKAIGRVRMVYVTFGFVLNVFTEGPVCKKMCDLTPQKVFKSSAFEPDREELQEAARASKRAKHSKPGPRKQVVRLDSDEEDDVSPVKSRFRGGTPLSDGSDEEMPNFSQLIANKGNFKKQNNGKKQKRVMSDVLQHSRSSL